MQLATYVPLQNIKPPNPISTTSKLVVFLVMALSISPIGCVYIVYAVKSGFTHSLVVSGRGVSLIYNA